MRKKIKSMNCPVVSIIVPIYKVEPYLMRCVNSILNQTYKEIEIILVNDGSPDRCGEIADTYEKNDKRVKVIHRKNGGLSDARNAGMLLATGDFIVFVDSDDWLDKQMIKKLVHTSIEFQADIVQSAFYYAYNDHLLLDTRVYKPDTNPFNFKGEALMAELVSNERVKNFAWGKLYKTELIRDLPFKKGVLFEDVFWAHHVMHRAENFVLIHEPLYYYFQREDSIVASYTARNLDILQGLQERHLFIKKHYEQLIDESNRVLLKTSLIHYNLLWRKRKEDRNGLHRKNIEEFIRNNYEALINASKNDVDLSRELKLFLLHPLLNIGYLSTKKVLRKAKILPVLPGLKRMERIVE